MTKLNASSYLEGIYAPVTQELTLDALEVEGELPRDLRGMYVQNNPNPRFTPEGRYHWFDGDGMVHGVRIADGRASYANRYVQTEALARDEATGAANWRGIMEPIDTSHPGGPDKDTANTDLTWHNGKLIATWWLGGQAVELNVPQLETVGVAPFMSKLSCGVASHPKVDPRTGDLVFFDYSPYEAPYLHYGVVSGDGERVHVAPIDVPGPRLFHDIAITEKYSILLDLPMTWDPAAVEAGWRKVDFDRSLPSRFGVIPRFGTQADIRWFETPPCYIYHTVNAWEEVDARGHERIVMTGCRIEDPIPTCPQRDELHVPRLSFLRLDPYLTRWVFDLTSGEVTEEPLDDIPTEFPRMNDAFLTHESRYAYHPRVAREPTLLFDGVIKYDLGGGPHATYAYGDDHFGGETVFAAREGGDGTEDDGYVVTYVQDRRAGTTHLVVLDARNIEAGPIAKVHLPRRVPVGFHACWVPGEGLGGRPV